MTDLFLKLLDKSVTAGWLVLAVLLLRLLLRRAPKWIFPVLWGFVEIRLLLPCLLESSFSVVPNATSVNICMAEVLYRAGMLHDLLTLVGIVWCIGTVAMLVYGAARYLQLRHRLKTAVRLGRDIYQSEYVRSPFIFGMFSPKIYLPYHINSHDAANVIAHERAHIKRKDHLQKPFAFVLLSVYWFNPLIWIAYILLCEDIEQACDERVIRNMDDEQRANYSQTLLSCSSGRRSIACMLTFRSRAVKRRIKSVLNYRKPSVWIIGITILTFLILGACFLTNPRVSKADSVILKQGKKAPQVTAVENTVSEMQASRYGKEIEYLLLNIEDLERKLVVILSEEKP